MDEKDAIIIQKAIIRRLREKLDEKDKELAAVKKTIDSLKEQNHSKDDTIETLYEQIKVLKVKKS